VVHHPRAEVIASPAILKALSPTYGVEFFLDNGATGFLALGSVVLAVTGAEAEELLRDFVEEVRAMDAPVFRAPGTAVCLTGGKESTPLALRENVDHNHVVHQCVVIVSVETRRVPHVNAPSGWWSTSSATRTTAFCTSLSATASRTNRTCRRRCGKPPPKDSRWTST
jgi:K+ transporter